MTAVLQTWMGQSRRVVPTGNVANGRERSVLGSGKPCFLSCSGIRLFQIVQICTTQDSVWWTRASNWFNTNPNSPQLDTCETSKSIETTKWTHVRVIAVEFKQRYRSCFVSETGLAPKRRCFGSDPISMLLASWHCHPDSLHGSILFLFEGCESWPYGAHLFVFCGAISRWWRLR